MTVHMVQAKVRAESVDGVENPLPGFPEFQEFLEGVEASRAEPANVQPMTVIGSYRMF